jgi:CRISPR-associated helicase Cas3/CRISPR-associated endonuclease Cas3-HD
MRRDRQGTTSSWEYRELSSVERALLTVWGKSARDRSTSQQLWLPLYQHLDDTAGIARQLVHTWLAPAAKARIGRDLPGGTADVERLVVWLAAVHDLLKCSPAFACMEPVLCDHMRRAGLPAHQRLRDEPSRRHVHHALAGHLVVTEWLVRELGFDHATAQQLGSVIGSHHGVTPEQAQLDRAHGLRYLLGDGMWAQVREHLLERATAQAGGRSALTSYRQACLSRPSLVLLSALVIMSDWVASNEDLFPLRSLPAADAMPAAPDELATERRVATAWAALNIPSRWQPQPFAGDVDRLLRQRFNRTGARPAQVAAVAAAVAQPDPGLIIIEAPMGYGKTEAALLVAEVLALRWGAHGVFVALPTQATTNAMFLRVLEWLSRLDGVDGSVSASLAHGKAQLNEAYRGLVAGGRFAAVDDNGAGSIVAHWWLSGRKKSGLAAFVVGTIDQLLFAALRSRHLMLRHLSLAGKVVVIDEVHAYDVYMSQYLHRVLHWLGAYRTPVVLLSATLPHQRRAELLRAYDSGRGGIPSVIPHENHGYPIVSTSGGAPPQPLPHSGDGMCVQLDRLDDSLDTLVAYLHEHLTEGCAAVIRNTVVRVQETAERLMAEFGEDAVTITHSRFLACDRARIDEDLRSRFGPPGPDGRQPDQPRPRRHIVVASQVLEQSLDVDFDLLVTDLAPADLLLQRLGRLHRHRRKRPEPVRTPRCALTGVESWTAAPVRAAPGSRRVYEEHLLLRSAALFHERQHLTLPHEISPIVEAAYDDRPIGPDSWRAAMDRAATEAAELARQRATKAQSYLLGEATDAGLGNAGLIGWLSAGVGDALEDSPRGLAQVRDGAESMEVLVVQRDADGGLRTADWVPGGGAAIPADAPLPPEQARIIAACSLLLPRALSHDGVIDAVVAELTSERYPAFEKNPLLAGRLVLALDHDRRKKVCSVGLYYDVRRGLVHARA